MSVEIREHKPGHDLSPFVEVPHELFAGDPQWVPPLHMEIKERLTPSKNPFFEHADVAIWTAWRGVRPVGRITAQIDREHLRTHHDDAGFFGFLDTTDDAEVASALLERASDWVRKKGMKTIRGPISLNINEEVGCLVEGFDRPPSLMMPHHLPYQGGLIEKAGFEKAMDLYAWHYEVGKVPERARKGWEQIVAMPDVRIRSVRMGELDREIPIILEIFNDAWKSNWGFVAATEAEAKKMVKDLKLLLNPELAIIVELSGRPVAIAVALPNLNEVIRDLNGRLFPLGILKLYWRLKVKTPRTGRLMLLGIREDLRYNRKYAAMSLAMYVELNDRGKRLGIESGELSWTLESNGPVNAGIRMMGAKLYKRYRVYEKPL